MTPDHEPITDHQVDLYVDGLMEPAERQTFEARLPAHPDIVSDIEQQARIDASLARLFPAAQVSQQRLSEGLAAIVSTATPVATSAATLAGTSAGTTAAPSTLRQAISQRSGRRAVRIALVGLAAGLTWGVVVWQLGLPWRGGDEPADAPYFEPRRLAALYQEVIENGFEPYYECREADRFAATFERRQGRALRLAALPAGSRMLGLSYAGGLSRETTAMLCEIDGEPVIVFVDRLANDLAIAADHDAGEIKVHRVARDGLVFYEVSPFQTARVIDYLIAP